MKNPQKINSVATGFCLKLCAFITLAFNILIMTSCDKHPGEKKKSYEVAAVTSASLAPVSKGIQTDLDTCGIAQKYLSNDSLLQVVGGVSANQEFTSVDRFFFKVQTSSGNCEIGSLVMLSTSNESLSGYLKIFWLSEHGQHFTAEEVSSFDIDKGGVQGTNISVAGEYPISKNCSVICLRTESSSHYNEAIWVTTLHFYILDDSDYTLREIFSFEERNLVYVEGEDGFVQTNEKAVVDVLETSTDGFRDVTVTKTSRQSDEQIVKSSTTFRFDKEKMRYEHADAVIRK